MIKVIIKIVLYYLLTSIMIINNKYYIINEIGQGAFGRLYSGKHIYTDEPVAIKLQLHDGEVVIRNEAKILKLLLNTEGVPRIKAFGKQNGVNYMVIDLLGNNIERLVGNTDVKYVCAILRILVTIIEGIHNKGVVHRDLKPDNVLFSIDKKSIYVIDYGISAMYVDEDGKHLPEQRGRPLIGNISFVSKNIHSGYNPSRRDDVISLCYMAFYLLSGSLPWSLVDTDTVGFIKNSVNFREYYGDIVNDKIYNVYEYCNKLTFKEAPNYDYICKQLTL
jgi:serine/threonine protein kinase|tara:strand:+ start:235 stop:1065 length:831 start_codon:yes stop_codon:yes gene_type:complete